MGLWADTFSNFSLDNKAQETYAEAIEVLKKEVRNMLMAATSIELIKLIDTVERLGLAYHFETEIEEKLEQIYNFHDEAENYDLFTTALRFRLLRQHRPYSDTREDILDEAAKFTRHHLSLMVPKLECPMKYKVMRALEHPHHRDRVIECYLWGAAFHFEPQYSYVRTIVAKNMQMVSIMDDTYDNYATLEEDQLFTDILERWDMDEIDRLPDFMKVVYRFIMSIYEDYERDAAKLDKSFAAPYYKETVKQLGRAYNQEQQWIMERKMPSFEEYMNNSVITSCIYVMFTALVPGMKSVTKETIDWLMSEPKILISTAKMGRHLEDLGTHERENREGKLLTVVDCYMKHYGVSKQEALSKFVELIEDGWKNVNKEWVTSSSIPKEMVEQLLNYVRVAEVTYKNKEDGYTYPEKYLAPQIAAIFVDPIVI
ncbi:hypothetical protein DH2020_027743 [Rehmannia glutinosa]|uniref:Uncharacterized protein n=1 Tax=Rehmannia glutinosa TaxID=99300 RepID=A0ABR0VWX2_REHGL